MTNFNSEKRLGEFELIAKFFAPLSRGAPGAYGLTDDAATIAPPPGEELVVTTDLLTAGVHFRADDPADRIARKALRVNLSDLAAKGACPHGYFVSLALPRQTTAIWLEAFADGLAHDQSEFAVTLFGGDTTATDGPLTISVTAFGSLPVGTMIRRNGAKPGDLVFVSGSIGDSGAGLAVLKGGGGKGMHAETLIYRYQIPSPRISLGTALRGVAHASLDISDGLIADLGHIADNSRVRIIVDADKVPISSALEDMRGLSQDAIVRAVTAGDDYEIAFTVSPSARDVVARIAGETNTPVTEIGRVAEGGGAVLLNSSGAEIPVSRQGYEHF